MTAMTMVQAINSALDCTMARDPNVLVMGEDVGFFGGVFRCTEGLYEKYGAHRALDTPIAEGGIVGAAIGMGVNGLRPVVEMQFADYIYPAIDQIISELARQDRLVVVESLELEAPKTKLLVKQLGDYGLDNVLIVSAEVGENLYLAARNLHKVDVRDVDGVDPVSLIGHEKVMVTVDAVKKFEEMLG